MRSLSVPVVLAALFTTTPQLVVGQGGGSIGFDARPGAEFQSEQLGEFLAKNLSVSVDEQATPPDDVNLATLRMELVSREEGVVGRWESEPVEVEAGMTYSGSTFSPPVFPISAPGFGDRRKIGFLGFGVWEDVREAWRTRYCEDATHAVQITLVMDDEPFVKNGQPMICLTANR